MNKVVSVWFYGLVTAAVDKTLFEAGALPDVNNIQGMAYHNAKTHCKIIHNV